MSFRGISSFASRYLTDARNDLFSFNKGPVKPKRERKPSGQVESKPEKENVTKSTKKIGNGNRARKKQDGNATTACVYDLSLYDETTPPPAPAPPSSSAKKKIKYESTSRYETPKVPEGHPSSKSKPRGPISPPSPSLASSVGSVVNSGITEKNNDKATSSRKRKTRHPTTKEDTPEIQAKTSTKTQSFLPCTVKLNRLAPEEIHLLIGGSSETKEEEVIEPTGAPQVNDNPNFSDASSHSNQSAISLPLLATPKSHKIKSLTRSVLQFSPLESELSVAGLPPPLTSAAGGAVVDRYDGKENSAPNNQLNLTYNFRNCATVSILPVRSEKKNEEPKDLPMFFDVLNLDNSTMIQHAPGVQSSYLYPADRTHRLGYLTISTNSSLQAQLYEDIKFIFLLIRGRVTVRVWEDWDQPQQEVGTPKEERCVTLVEACSFMVPPKFYHTIENISQDEAVLSVVAITVPET